MIYFPSLLHYGARLKALLTQYPYLRLLTTADLTDRNTSYSIIFLYYIFSLKNVLLRLFTPPPGLTTQMPLSQTPVGEQHLWTTTLDRYTSAGLPECVASTMSGPPPETTQDRTLTKDTHAISRHKLKLLTPPGIEPGPPGRKAGNVPTTPRRMFKRLNYKTVTPTKNVVSMIFRIGLRFERL